jgi:hypothetical protein
VGWGLNINGTWFNKACIFRGFLALLNHFVQPSKWFPWLQSSHIYRHLSYRNGSFHTPNISCMLSHNLQNSIYWHFYVKPQGREPKGSFPLGGKDLNSVTDEALVALLTTAPILHQLGGTTVVRLSETLVMKGVGSVLASEAEMLRLVASRTTIRAPEFIVRLVETWYTIFWYI